MAKEALDSRDRQGIRDLLSRGSRVMGLYLCYHDNLRRSGLPRERQEHGNPACMAVKRDHQDECARFCGGEMDRGMPSRPEGSLHVCPFGHTDLAAPVFLDGLLVGVLFASACWTGDGDPPRPGLVIPPDSHWLEDRRLMLTSLAKSLEGLLRGGTEGGKGDSRKGRIAAYLAAHLHEAPRLGDVAGMLNLSPSRTGHLIRELFGETFPRLLTRIRLTRAARLLSVTDTPAGRIALETGFADQSHFTRAFTHYYGKSPLAYRKAHRIGV